MSSIVFVSPSTVAKKIRTNLPYYKRFSPQDWTARGVKNLAQYLSSIVVTDFDADQRRKLCKAVRQAKRDFSRIQVDWFDGKVAMKIPFKFGAIADDSYENGYPHTIGDVILLTTETVDEMSDEDLAELIKHEQTHVFQRKFPKYVRCFLKQFGYRRLKKQHPRDGIRANPDTDGITYERLGRVYAFPYRNEVRGLHSIDYSHVKRHPRYEHPFEDMAYRVSGWKEQK